jgi:hypothetical protein
MNIHMQALLQIFAREKIAAGFLIEVESMWEKG